MNGFRISIRYGFVRSRQLEGTFPGDKETGSWPITSLRVLYGWGAPPEESWPYGTDWPPEEPPGIDAIAKRYRSLWPYRRVRTIADGKNAIGEGPGILVSVDIDTRWANPWRGVIPAPSTKDIPYPTMHHVVLVRFNPNRDEFKFRNSWGPQWGDGGYGYISAERLEPILWEAWRQIPTSVGSTAPSQQFPNLRTREFTQSDGTTLHWLEFVDEDDERIGWASAIQNRGSLEAEELFVRPNYRRRGYGKKPFHVM